MDRILVTGAAGSIGSALVNRLLELGFSVCLFDNSEEGLFKLRKSIKVCHAPNVRFFLGDIRDRERLMRAFNGVTTVFHCAAYKHVEICEYNAFEAVQTNVIGTQNVIDAALVQRVSNVVFASSDKAVNPTSTMGSTKMLAERLITSAASWQGNTSTVFTAVRFGNVWNSSGSVSTVWKKQICSGYITLTDPRMSRFVITFDEAIDLCLFASRYPVSGSIIVKSMGSVNMGDLANTVCKSLPNVQIRLTGAIAGEKLYEELLTEQESLMASLDQGYYIIKSNSSFGSVSTPALSVPPLRSDNDECQSESLLHSLVLDLVVPNKTVSES